MTPFYRALLRLYPSSFRVEYAAELARTYEASVRERGRVGASIAAIADVVPNALAAHWAILVQDLRYTARTLRGSRGFALAAILITALGVGANTATFSVADFVLVRPLSFPDPDALVRFCDGPRTGGGWGCMNQMSPARYRDFVVRNKSLTTAGAFARRAVNLVGEGEPLRVSSALVTPEVLPLLGIRPLVGRVFDTVAADRDAQTVVIGYGLWQSQFGGDRDVVGKTVNLDGAPYTVIGVMPAHFLFPTADVQLWMPIIYREADYAERGNNPLEGVGRLKPGVTFEQARADVAAFLTQLTRDRPDEYADRGFSFFRQRDEMSPRYRVMLLALCGASLCMLLLTCANLANLLLARAAGRERELAVRAALGAGRERLMRQMLTETVTLALIGGLAGALVAALAVPLLARLVPSTMPMASQPTVDLRVFAIAATLSALTGLGFGLLPAMRVGGRTGFSALREGSRGSGRRKGLRTVLVAVEVTVSVVLLIASGLLIRAMMRVQAIDPGFSVDRVLTLTTALPIPKYDSVGRRADFYQRVLMDVRALPGVEGAAYISGLPFRLTGGIARVLLPGEEDRRDGSQNASYRLVTSQFFSTMRIPVRQGRDVRETDTRDGQLVAVVSESFGKRRFPNQDPIGKVIEVRGDTLTIVGVVGDVKVRGLERNSEPQLYLPANQALAGLGDNYHPKDLVVRSSLREGALLPAIRDAVRRVDPQQPISNIRMLSELLGDQTATRRAQLRVLAALAALALILAAVGIHGLLSFTVAQRDREIGVRLALGAEPKGVAGMIVSEGVRMALIGVVPGVAIAYLAARGMSALLFGVSPNDPVTIGIVAVVCFVTAVAACVGPALRAARIHPMSALRAD
jgi:predicted permease